LNNLSLIEIDKGKLDEARKDRHFQDALARATVLNAQVKSEATQNLKWFFCRSTLKTSEI
jgi:uncharacterized protein (DUF2236 family)